MGMSASPLRFLEFSRTIAEFTEGTVVLRTVLVEGIQLRNSEWKQRTGQGLGLGDVVQRLCPLLGESGVSQPSPAMCSPAGKPVSRAFQWGRVNVGGRGFTRRNGLNRLPLD